MFKDIFKLLRPKQWIKNVFVFAALIFSENLFNAEMLLQILLAFGVFCIISSSSYILNDLADLKEDREHPVKKNRPLASGRVSKKTAVSLLVLFLLTGFMLGFSLSSSFAIIVVCYFLLQVLYSLYIKNIVILDVFSISIGFVLRTIAGALAINVPMSRWFLLCAMLISLFLAFCKRRHELILLHDNAPAHRKVLKEYSPYLLDQMIAVVTPTVIVSYALYTMSQETIAKFDTQNLIFTLPFVLYGIFRYLYLVHKESKGGSPEEALMQDLPSIINIIFFGIAVVLILYFR